MKTTERKNYLSPEVIISSFNFEGVIAASADMTLSIDIDGAEEELW